MVQKSSYLKTACAYIRVSTDKQEELSPDAQKRLILDYAVKNNILLEKENIFVENGISGKKADKRPEFMRMIALAKQKEHPFDVILVWKFSRFARNQEESIVYKALLKKNSVDVVSISEPLVDGPFGTLIERIIEWMDEYYSIRLSGEVMRGMSEKALRGGYQAGCPLGYKMNKETKIPEIDEEQAEIVKKIFNDYTNELKSYLEIARELNSLGFRTKRGAMYEARTIQYILQNPFYIGKIRWNRQNHAEHTIKDESEWIIADAEHEPIIDAELFNRTQQRIQTVSRPYRQRAPMSLKHWLSGIVKCSSCGASLVCSINSNTFQCLKYAKGSCMESHWIKTEHLEKAVFEAFEKAINGDVSFELRHSSGSSSDEQHMLNERLKKLEMKEMRIKQAYAEGIDTIEEYRQNKQLLENEKKEILEILKKKTATESPAEQTNAMIKSLSSVYTIIKDNSQTKKNRANALRSVVDHMTYDKQNDNLKVFFFLQR